MSLALRSAPSCKLWRGLPPRPAVKSAARRPTCVRYVSAASQSDDSQLVAASDTPVTKAMNFFKSQAPKFLGAMLVAAVLMMSSPGMSEAARSGGRVGGSGFSSGRSFSSGGSYGGGGRSYGGAPATRYRGSTSYRSYGGPGVSRTTVVAPSFGWGFSPFGYYSPAPVFIGGGGSSLFTILILAIFAFVAFQAISGSFGGDDYEDYEDMDNGPMSVVKLQVGLLGSARELQRDLNRMGNTLDTSSPSGLHYLLQETVLALRRNPQYAMYGKAELTKTRGLDNAESAFNRVSMEERGKFERETLSNVSGRTSRNVAKVTGDGMNEMIVVTVVAAIDGKVEPGSMNSQEDLKANLDLLGSVPVDRLLALEVLWTPQDENDYFTREELVTDYPTLNML